MTRTEIDEAAIRRKVVSELLKHFEICIGPGIAETGEIITLAGEWLAECEREKVEQ